MQSPSVLGMSGRDSRGNPAPADPPFPPPPPGNETDEFCPSRVIPEIIRNSSAYSINGTLSPTEGEGDFTG
jgi:hypothetical protein